MHVFVWYMLAAVCSLNGILLSQGEGGRRTHYRNLLWLPSLRLHSIAMHTLLGPQPPEFIGVITRLDASQFRHQLDKCWSCCFAIANLNLGSLGLCFVVCHASNGCNDSCSAGCCNFIVFVGLAPSLSFEM